MFTTKFVYDLFGKPEPSVEELDEEIDRLFYIKGNVGEPTFLMDWNEKDQLGPLDSEVISLWIRRKFEPALTLMLLKSDENLPKTRKELLEMGKYDNQIDKLLRARYVEKRAHQRIIELCFDDNTNLNLQKAVTKLKRALTFLSKHLEQNSAEHLTLQQTRAFTLADITLYNYLKRIIVGKYKDSGLKSHVKLCSTLRLFMSRYESKNPLIEPAREDLSDEKANLVQDLTKPAIIALGIILLFLWRRG